MVSLSRARATFVSFMSVRLTASYKNFKVPLLKVLFCNATHCVCKNLNIFSVSLWEVGLEKQVQMLTS